MEIKLVYQIIEEKKVVILYWAVWCPPCKEEVPIINELSKEYNDAIFLTIVSPTLGRKFRI